LSPYHHERPKLGEKNKEAWIEILKIFKIIFQMMRETPKYGRG
jgi:hypothetical protein